MCELKLFLTYAISRQIVYHMRAIISRDLYPFYPIFHCGLYQEWLILETIYVVNKETLQKQSAVCNQEGVKMGHVR